MAIKQNYDSGLIRITSEQLQIYQEKCKLSHLTLGCLKAQLNLTDEMAIFINGEEENDIEFEIELTDKVIIVPPIAGGTFLHEESR